MAFAQGIVDNGPYPPMSEGIVTPAIRMSTRGMVLVNIKSPLTLDEAVLEAEKYSPDFRWRQIFGALQAAGLIGFATS